jgi:hypothetical protein
MTPAAQINVKFNPIVKTIPVGFDPTITYPVMAIDRIEEGDDLVTEFLLVDSDGKFQWVKADMLVSCQMSAEPRPAYTKHNGGYEGRTPNRAPQVRRAY